MKYSLFFASILAATTVVSIPIEEAQYITERELAASSLHDGIVAKGKEWFGTCADPNTISNAACVDVIKKHFGQVTPENSMKWESIQRTRGQFNYANSDRLVAFAEENGKKIHGHTFVWHSQLPDWVKQINNRQTLTTVIETHIAELAGRYKGKMKSWDVLNEIFEENGSLRSSVFKNVLGEDFIKIAFDAARKADPDAFLYINDYNLNSSQQKRQGMINIVKKWKAAGVPIDGIGTQCHLNAGQIQNFEQHLKELASAGVPVAITELDIQNASANDYTTVVRACLNVPQCKGITVWGVADSQSWRSNTSPLLFTNSFQPKPAATAILNIL